jgi:GNAT superfamily N-acetyltransferase
MRIEPATADTWADLKDLFGPNGASSGCWCMYFRTTSREWADGCRDSGTMNQHALLARLDVDPPPGLLGYDDDGVPAGWCAVAPRVEYGRVLRSRTTKPGDPDDPTVWAVTCFYIRRGHRGHGVASALLDAAIAFAKEHGAAAIEGYPVDPLGRRRQNAELYYGTFAMFRAGGFTEVERRSSTRPIMRLDLAR